MADAGEGGAGDGADGGGVGGDVAPGVHGEAFGGGGGDDGGFGAFAAEEHGDAVGSGGGEVGEGLAEEGVGDAQEQAGAIAGVGVVAGGAAVHEALEDGQAGFDDVVRGFARQARDEADAAGVVFVGGVVEAGGGREGCHGMLLEFLEDNSDNWKDDSDNGLEGEFFENKFVNWTKFSTKGSFGLSESRTLLVFGKLENGLERGLVPGL